MIEKISNDYSFDQDTGFFKCEVCLEKKDPYLKGALSDKTGIFRIDLDAYQACLALSPNTQPESFRNLKKALVKHIKKSERHLKNAKLNAEYKKIEAQKHSRNYDIGIGLARIRYNDIKHGNSYLSFEDSVVTANLNGTDTGDINNSRQFAKDITVYIKEVMDEKLKDAISTKLVSTGHNRQVGVISDKITPNKRTGHIMGLVLPVPENPLSEPFLCPIHLNVPHVTDHTADGLAEQMLGVLHEAGVEDSQISGFGVDGQYIKMGVLNKLLNKLNLPESDISKLSGWILQTWEPAHNLNLADQEIREKPVFDWLVRFINIIKEVTGLLNIGKGLEQTIAAAEELNMKNYRLQGFSSTRFAAYFEVSLENFIRSFPIIVRALEERKLSREKKVREEAEKHLGHILDAKFVLILLGTRDIYRVIATTSCKLQKVEQFQWEVVRTLKSAINKLADMADKMQIDDDNSEVDDADWSSLSKNIQDIKRGQFMNIALEGGSERRHGRIRDYMGHQNDFTTVQNRLSSLAKAHSKTIKSRTIDNKDCPFPPILESMENCLDINILLNSSNKAEFEVDNYGIEDIENVLKKSLESEVNWEEIKDQYREFKTRALMLLTETEGVYSHLHTENQHLLFETHKCTEKCRVVRQAQCKDFQKIVEPRVVRTMKVLHLFLKSDELYEGLDKFLHLFVSVATKTHAEGVAESMGNYVEMHAEKKRGLDINEVGVESFIHWNGPPVGNATSLLEAALDKRFKGRKSWRFVTKQNNLQSKVVKRLKSENSRVPFFDV